MINSKRVIAIIPARGGSSRLLGKNIKKLHGKPLIAWTVEKAKKSKYLDEIMVTTDNQEISDVSKEYGASVPFLRPVELAGDDSPTYDAIEHALKYYQDCFQQEFDYIVLLEPTSPLREDDDIDNMLEKLDEHENEFDSIVSVGQVFDHANIIKHLEGMRVEPFFSSSEKKSKNKNSAPAFFPYGVAYIVKTNALLKEKTVYTKKCMSHIIKRYQNYEIDDIYDFICVDNVMKYEWGLK